MQFDLPHRPHLPAEGFVLWTSVGLAAVALLVLLWVLVQVAAHRSKPTDRRAWSIAFSVGALAGLGVVWSENRVIGADAYMLVFLLIWFGLAGLLGSLSLVFTNDPERRRLGVLSFQSVGLSVLGFWSSLLAYLRLNSGY